jgi:SAM-dependent methyltransferase
MKVSDEAELERAFGAAEPDHFAWQTEQPVVADRERELVRAAFLPLGTRVLDVGCGEGATLLHLGAPTGAVGVDLFEDKLRFARERLPECKFVVASGLSLPFEDGAFDHVLVRDVIHHVEDAPAFARELGRVLAPGGRIDVLEPCRYNPLIALHALTTKVERGELRSTMPFLARLFEDAGFVITSKERLQPMPIHRLVFHPKLGRPSLAEQPLVRAAVDGIERLFERALPRAVWAYLHLRAER